MERIIHLRGREKALETEWGVRDAEWIALVCLHSGAFTRTQYQAYFGGYNEQARRFVRRMVDQGMATETGIPQPWGRPLQVCHITHKRLYRALRVPNIRHRREADVDVLYRRLVSLDYVIEHPDFEWLPTESEKLGAFADGLGLAPEILPHRTYGRNGSGVTRYFHVKLPIALIPEQRTVLFVFVDPGYDTDTALRSWGEDHAALWEALRQGLGLGVRVVVIGATAAAERRAERVGARWLSGAAAIRVGEFDLWRSRSISGQAGQEADAECPE